MAVPNSIADLSVTPSSNAPAGSEARSSADDYMRSLAAFLRQTVSAGSDIASATTITPSATASSYGVTGTTAITTIASTNSWDGRLILLRFAGALTFTHGSNLNLPGAANITTAAGDIALVRQRTSGTWDCVMYQKASGLSVVSDLNTNWSFDGSNRFVNGGNTQPAFRATRETSDQTSGSTLIYNSEAYDQGSNYSTSTGLFTAPVDGVYAFSAGAAFLGPGDVVSWGIYFEGSSVGVLTASGMPEMASTSAVVCASVITRLAAAETMAVKTGNGLSSSVKFMALPYSQFSGYLLA